MVAIVPRIKNTDGSFPFGYTNQVQETEEFAVYLRDISWKSPGVNICWNRIVIVLDVYTNIVSILDSSFTLHELID